MYCPAASYELWQDSKRTYATHQNAGFPTRRHGIPYTNWKVVREQKELRKRQDAEDLTFEGFRSRLVGRGAAILGWGYYCQFDLFGQAGL